MSKKQEMSEARKKQLFTWTSIIGSIVIFSIFIWSMGLNLSGFGSKNASQDTQQKSPDSNIPQANTENTDEIKNIIDSVDQDAQKSAETIPEKTP